MDRYLEFATRHPMLIAAAAALIALIVVTELKRALRRWQELSPFELTQRVNAGALLLDLRGAEAHRAGHIAGAVATTLDGVEAAVAKQAKDAPVVAYCESGATSEQAAARLVAAGHTAVATLRGGLASWRADSLPLAKD